MWKERIPDFIAITLFLALAWAVAIAVVMLDSAGVDAEIGNPHGAYAPIDARCKMVVDDDEAYRHAW